MGVGRGYSASRGQRDRGTGEIGNHRDREPPRSGTAAIGNRRDREPPGSGTTGIGNRRDRGTATDFHDREDF